MSDNTLLEQLQEVAMCWKGRSGITTEAVARGLERVLDMMEEAHGYRPEWDVLNAFLEGVRAHS